MPVVSNTPSDTGVEFEFNRADDKPSVLYGSGRPRREVIRGRIASDER